MRILFVSPDTTLEAGASQIAATLAREMAARGHQATLWVPSTPPIGQWPWLHRRTQGRELARYAISHGPFDVVDTFPVLIEPALVGSSKVVARSVQPDLLYLQIERASLLSQRGFAKKAFHILTIEVLAARVRRAYRFADRILALGAAERAWIAARFPAVADRLGSYLVAPPEEDQRNLARVRQERQSAGPAGKRFLWIGRWATHKGTGRLLAWAQSHLGANPHDHLTIAGYGEAPADEMARLSPFCDRVTWVARFQRHELPQLLANHDFGLFTSIEEGWGISLNEMLESGMTVFATEIGGVPMLRKHFPRQLRAFPPRTSELADEPDDPGANGYFDIWSWPRIAAEYEAQVELALSARRR